ncbi:MAG TPA: hypothetical protein VFK47_03240 [Ktedonobacteraceae bacterium]|nr:hypothetical protein [Ktedonobacteraceae bacterium]
MTRQTVIDSGLFHCSPVTRCDGLDPLMMWVTHTREADKSAMAAINRALRAYHVILLNFIIGDQVNLYSASAWNI